MPSPSSALPDFSAPPVVETLLGVEYSELDEWNVAHFGLYWERIRSQFPRFEVHPPLVSQIEGFETPKMRSGPRVELVTQPDLRCWLIGERQLIQVQNTRYFYNWRKDKADQEYPRYEVSVRPSFEQHWEQFCSFLADNDIQTPNVLQCEITYVNHLERGREWQSFDDLSDVLTFHLDQPDTGFLPSPEGVNFAIRFVIPGNMGRLHVTAVPAIRNSDGQEIIQLNLVARGRPASSELTDLLSWFDRGREWIVRGFTELTTDKMHKLWERNR